MSWKGLFVLLIILLLIGVLVSGEEIKQLLNRFRDFVSGMWGLVTGKPKEEVETFPLKVLVKKESMHGQSFNFEYSTLSITGMCMENPMLDGIELEELARKACSVKSQEASGEAEFSPLGTLSVTLASASVTVNDQVYTAESLVLGIELAPTTFRFSNVSKDLIFLISTQGEAYKFKPTGAIDLTKYLEGENVQIQNFEGNIVLENLTLTLEGHATSLSWD